MATTVRFLLFSWLVFQTHHVNAYNAGFDGSKTKGAAARFKPDSSSEHDSSWTSFDHSASKGSEVDAWCSQTQQRIVGYYQANACASDSSPTQCALKISDKIAEQFDGAVLLMLDGSKMPPDYRVPPIVMYERKDSRWILKDKHMIMLRQWEETRAIASQMLEAGDHALLVDFDSHLDDITKDWTNQKLNAKIAELSSPPNGNI
uniref:ER membrane protein complex subunit 9 n=1 Tax=Oryzias latipes TaxID=8090 RepID=A0A3P9K1K3_ORYLA